MTKLGVEALLSGAICLLNHLRLAKIKPYLNPHGQLWFIVNPERRRQKLPRPAFNQRNIR